LKYKEKILPPFKHDNKIILTPEEKSNLLADNFEENHKNPLKNNAPKFDSFISHQTSRNLGNIFDFSEVDYPTVGELSGHIKAMKNRKSPGADNIHNSLIKNLPENGLIFLNLILAACLKLAYFPSKWKKANVIPIKKPGKDPSSVASYRPISLLSSLSKLLEKVILKRLLSFADSNNIIPKEQHGFRSRYSTTNQLMRITNYIKSKLNEKFSTGMILLDVEKAFDRVWHEGLIYKMLKLRFPLYLTKIVSSFLQGRSFQVSINGKLSSLRHFKFGVPQGAVLSPFLFNIFTSDFPRSQNCKLAMYADDTSFLSSSPYAHVIIRNLQTYAAMIKTYMTK
jgi:hypothetical protein